MTRYPTTSSHSRVAETDLHPFTLVSHARTSSDPSTRAGPRVALLTAMQKLTNHPRNFQSVSTDAVTALMSLSN